MSGTFRVERSVADQSAGRVEVIELAGDLDMATIEAFEEALAEEPGEAGPLLLDLTRLEFMDSTGLRGMLQAREGRDRIAVLISPESQVGRILEIAGVDEVLEIFGEREPAIAKLLE
jgi:anti-sigma B factor antagonist